MLPGLATLKPRPKIVHGATHRVETPVGTAFITVNCDDDGEPLEAFVNIGRAGSDILAMAESMGRMISLVLRTPSPLSQREKVEQLVDQLKGIAGSRSHGFGPESSPVAARCDWSGIDGVYGSCGRERRSIYGSPVDGAARREHAHIGRRPVSEVRSGVLRSGGRLQEVSFLRIQRMLGKHRDRVT